MLLKILAAHRLEMKTSVSYNVQQRTQKQTAYVCQLVSYKGANIIQLFFYIFSNIREEETLLAHIILLEITGLKRVKAYFSLISNIKSTQKGISMFHLFSMFSN